MIHSAGFMVVAFLFHTASAVKCTRGIRCRLFSCWCCVSETAVVHVSAKQFAAIQNTTDLGVIPPQNVRSNPHPNISLQKLAIRVPVTLLAPVISNTFNPLEQSGGDFSRRRASRGSSVPSSPNVVSKFTYSAPFRRPRFARCSPPHNDSDESVRTNPIAIVSDSAGKVKTRSVVPDTLLSHSFDSAVTSFKTVKRQRSGSPGILKFVSKVSSSGTGSVYSSGSGSSPWAPVLRSNSSKVSKSVRWSRSPPMEAMAASTQSPRSNSASSHVVHFNKMSDISSVHYRSDFELSDHELD